MSSWVVLMDSSRCPHRYTAGLMDGDASTVPYTACRLSGNAEKVCAYINCIRRARG